MSDFDGNFGVFYDKGGYAGFIRRVIASAIDLLVMLLISLVILFTLNCFIYDEAVYITFNFLLITLISVWYLALLKRSGFRTIGYILAGVKIVDLKGGKPSIVKMILRVFLSVIGPFEFIPDIFWIMSESTRQTLRDKFIGTYVVRKDAVPVGRAEFQDVTLGVMAWTLVYREIKGNRIK